MSNTILHHSPLSNAEGVKKQIYFDFEGFTYWHMENIINRCVIADTYHIRKLNNRLPKN